MSDWQTRAQRASESLSANEAVAAGLDGAAAGALLDWGRACAATIARATDGLADDDATAAMSPRLQAANRLLRAVARFAAHRDDMEPAVRIALMAHVVEQASLAYAGRSPALDMRGRAELLYRLAAIDAPVDVIAALRAELEPAPEIRGAAPSVADGPGRFGNAGAEPASDADDVADFGAPGDVPEEDI